MRLNNYKTGSLYEAGDPCAWNGKDVTIEKRIVKVKSIIEKDLQITAELVEQDGSHIFANFWKSDLGKNPNIFKDGEEYKLAEIADGDVIEIYGYEYDYHGFRQFNPCGGYKLTDEPFIIQNKNRTDLKDNLYKLINTIEDVNLKDTCNEMLSTLSMFYTHPAANKHHHNYAGGLLQHTYEVVAGVAALSIVYKADKDVLLASALFHDAMKTYEYTETGDYLPYASKVGHVVGSAEYFKSLAEKHNVSGYLVNEIYHCILAHHGRKEWGSPVEPQTIEAAILHESDMISSRVNPIALANVTDRRDYYIK